MFYRDNIAVEATDCDISGRMKLSAIMRYMQQTSGAQLEALGFPYQKLRGEGMVFLLSTISIKLHRVPVHEEVIRVGTVPVTPKGARFIRDFVLESSRGERLVSALSQWLLVDPETRRILRPQRFPYPLPFEAAVVESAMGDIEIPARQQGTEALRTELVVRYSHLDVNGHVNNSVYADLACDALPYHELLERGVGTLVLHYQSEAKWGDSLTLTTTRLPGGGYTVHGEKDGGTACFQALALLRGNAVQ